MTSNEVKKIWITWERHRRTRALADKFDAQLFEITHEGNRIVRYIYSALITFKVLLQQRPDVLIVQTPSYVLAFFAVIYRSFFNYTLVLDAHNGVTFRLEYKSGGLFSLIKYAVSNADLVIVTSESVYPVIKQYQQSVINLPDCIPDIEMNPMPEVFKGLESPLITLIASHQHDEPIEEILRAFEQVVQNNTGQIIVTGKKPKGVRYAEFEGSPNIIFAGFLSYEDFDGLIFGSDLLIDVSTDPTVLVCGGYEAIAVGVPALVSNSPVSRQVFKKGFLYADSTVSSYAAEITRFMDEREQYRHQIGLFKAEFIAAWEQSFSRVEEKIYNLRASRNNN